MKRRQRIGIVIGMSAFVAGVLAMYSMAPADTSERVETTRAELEKWVETRRLISKEERDFKVGREMLHERAQLLRAEIASVRQKIDEARVSITDTDRKRSDLNAGNEKLRSSSASLGTEIAIMEARTAALLSRVPEPIRERVKPLSQRFPADAQTSELSLAERFQNVVGVLNELNKFNGEITVGSAVIKLPEGSSVEVAALYIGISQGYYVGANGAVAGIGSPTPEGWEWTPADNLAPRVSQAVGILKNEQPAAYVLLPLELD